MNKADENFVKSRVIDYFIEKHGESNSLIASEVPFSSFKRRADIVLINDGDVWGIEIKTEFDKLDRLKDQLPDYNSFFNCVWVVIPFKNIKKARILLSDFHGIISYKKNGHVFEVRKPRRVSRTDKNSATYFLNTSEIQKKYTQHQKGTLDQIRETLKNTITFKEAKDIIIESLTKRYQDQYDLFMNNRGSKTHPDDIKILSSSYFQKELVLGKIGCLSSNMNIFTNSNPMYGT